VNLLDTSPDRECAAQTAPIDPVREALTVAAYLVTGLASGEPSICFEDERCDYGDEEHTPVFEPLCRLSDAEAAIAAALEATDAEIEALKADAEHSSKQQREECADLLKALKDLSTMYAQAWDLVDGGLTMMGDSVPLFESRHQAASKAIERYEASGTRARGPGVASRG
jgi:hypothetical protein